MTSYAPPPEVFARLDEENVEEALRAFYVTRADSSLRPEEIKKIPELAGILPVLARTRQDPLLVDAAAGRAPVGLMAARLLGWSKVVVIERDPGRPAASLPRATTVPPFRSPRDGCGPWARRCGGPSSPRWRR